MDFFAVFLCVAYTEIGDVIANEVPIEVMAINSEFSLFFFLNIPPFSSSYHMTHLYTNPQKIYL